MYQLYTVDLCLRDAHCHLLQFVRIVVVHRHCAKLEVFLFRQRSDFLEFSQRVVCLRFVDETQMTEVRDNPPKTIETNDFRYLV